jgi:phosphoribosylformimino-5-aminoimidazole carboxamide ribonucleotide (ProFAR) isomerase
MCLVNKSTYIAQYSNHRVNKPAIHGKWTATGDQFKVPYVFKTLFSHEPVTFDDMTETMTVQTAIYLDQNEGLEDVKEWQDVKDARACEAAGKKLTKKQMTALENLSFLSDAELDGMIAKGHDYRFVGKVGNFCPIKPGYGGGVLLRQSKNKFDSVNGAKGYRWLESETVRGTELENAIDRSYYDKLVDQAVEDISKYGDFEWFISTNDELYLDPIERDRLQFN